MTKADGINMTAETGANIYLSVNLLLCQVSVKMNRKMCDQIKQFVLVSRVLLVAAKLLEEDVGNEASVRHLGSRHS